MSYRKVHAQRGFTCQNMLWLRSNYRTEIRLWESYQSDTESSHVRGDTYRIVLCPNAQLLNIRLETEYLRKGHPAGNLSSSSPMPCGGESVIRKAILVALLFQPAEEAAAIASHCASGPSPPPSATKFARLAHTAWTSELSGYCWMIYVLSCGGWSRNVTIPNLTSLLDHLPVPMRLSLISWRMFRSW